MQRRAIGSVCGTVDVSRIYSKLTRIRPFFRPPQNQLGKQSLEHPRPSISKTRPLFSCLNCHFVLFTDFGVTVDASFRMLLSMPVCPSLSLFVCMCRSVCVCELVYVRRPNSFPFPSSLFASLSRSREATVTLRTAHPSSLWWAWHNHCRWRWVYRTMK